MLQRKDSDEKQRQRTMAHAREAYHIIAPRPAASSSPQNELEISPTMENAKDQGSSQEASENPPPLPLGWTTVRRKRSRDDDNDTSATEVDWCCDDPNCTRPQIVETSPNATIVKGHAIFCLHEMNPDWFQGYFQVEGQRKPWGLLATQESIDECLECSDGGYRQVSLKVLRYSAEKPTKLDNVQWTGGDMMRLQSSNVSMETHCLWTGKKAVPYIERFFSSLVNKLREETDEPVLDILPDLAIVTGPMTLTIPKQSGSGDDE
jgi:hypothetical protein